MNFLNVIKEMSAQSVRREASRPFVLALAGEPERVTAARLIALGPEITPQLAKAADPYLFCISPPYSDEEEQRLRYADLLVSFPGGPGPTDFRPADTIRIERPEELIPRILEHRPDLRIAAARRFPGFRPAAAEQVVREVSRINAEFATIAAIPSLIPALLPFFPAMAGADLLVLTKNQVIMMFRLAAIYGEDLDLKSRIRETLPVIGGAFGWRTIARELAGALPGPLGIPIKAGIAYSGTYAAGRAAQMVFDEGRRPTRQEMLRIYQEGSRLAREAVTHVQERLKRRKGGAGPSELPKPLTEEEEPGG
jgi:uncharacterized protein (DUF697 family)